MQGCWQPPTTFDDPHWLSSVYNRRGWNESDVVSWNFVGYGPELGVLFEPYFRSERCKTMPKSPVLTSEMDLIL